MHSATISLRSLSLPFSFFLFLHRSFSYSPINMQKPTVAGKRIERASSDANRFFFLYTHTTSIRTASTLVFLVLLFFFFCVCILAAVTPLRACNLTKTPTQEQRAGHKKKKRERFHNQRHFLILLADEKRTVTYLIQHRVSTVLL